MSNRTALAGGILLALALCAGLALWLGRTTTPASSPRAAATGRGGEERIAALEIEPEIAAPGRSVERTGTAAPVEVIAGAGAPPDPDAIVVTVVVLDSASTPLEGASVTLTWKGQSEPAVIETDSDGTASLTLPTAVDVHVHAVAQGHEHATVSATHLRSQRWEFRVRRLAGLEGRVLDAVTGQPIAGAEVTRFLGSRCDVCPPCTATTDALGGFELDCVPLEGEQAVERPGFGIRTGTWIHASAEGYASDLRALVLEEPGAFLELRLLPAAELSFRVRDQGTGLPLAGARIESTRRDVVVTDAQGEARSARMLEAGGRDAIGLTCEAAGFAILSLRIDPLTHDPSRPVDIELPRLARVAVTVADPDGNPVLATVSMAPEPSLDRSAGRREANLGAGWNLRAPRSSSSTGSLVELEVLADLPHQLTAYAQGYALHRASVTTPAPGAAGEQRVVLVPEALAHGVLQGRVHSDGHPVAAVISWSGPTRTGITRSHSSGTFHAVGVEPGTSTLRLTNMLTGRELVPREWTVLVVAGETTELDLDLGLPTTTIEGRAVHADGTPAQRRSVFAHASDALIATHDTTDSLGRFELTVQADIASYTLVARVGPRASGLDVELEGVAPGATGVELVLPQLAELRWRALEADTQRVVDRAELLWASPGEDLWDEHATPDAEGWQRIELPSGTYDLGARQARGSLLPVLRERVEVHPGMAPITFELERGHELVVELADGQTPWPEVAILLLDDRQHALLPGDSLQSSTRIVLRGRPTTFGLAEGPTRLTGLAPGRHHLRAFPDVIAIEPAEVVVGPDTPEVELRWSYR